MTMQMGMKITGYKEAKREMKVMEKQKYKAMTDANKIVGFHFRKIMMAELRKGTPGGRDVGQLSKVMLKYKKLTKARGRKPLAWFNRFIRYTVHGNKRPEMQLGIVTRGNKAVAPGIRKRIKEQVNGYTTTVNKDIRSFFIRYGRPKHHRGKPLTLRKETTTLKTPARPFIEPFLKKYERAMGRLWEKVYRMKLEGKQVRM